MILSLMTIGCSKNDASDNSTITAEEAGINAKMDIANDDVSNVVETQLQATLNDGVNGKSAEMASTSCPLVSRTPAFGTVLVSGDVVTKTIDFGTGCTQPNGNVLKGIITINFIYNPTASSHTVTYTFNNFYHNARKFEGTKTFTRTMTVATAASPAHPIVTMLMDMTMTLPDGRVFTRVGTRTREITAGYGTPATNDNEYTVTGNWTTTFPSTTVQTSTITTPLIIKLACNPTFSPISQGVITFTRNSHTATLDYGNGDCDNLAVFTINGVAHNIVLGI